MVDQSVLLAQFVLAGARIGLAAALALVIGRVLVALVLALLARAVRRRSVASTLAVAARRTSPGFLRATVGVVIGTGLVVTLVGAPAGAAPGRGAARGVPVLDRVLTQVVSGSSPGWRDAQPPARPSRADSATDPVRPRTRLHVVRPGESLWSIAAATLRPHDRAPEVARSWPRWFAANRDVIGDDPDRLRPGQRLQPPDAA